MASLSDLLGRQIARVRRSIELLTADRAQLPAPSAHTPREHVAPAQPALRSLLAFAAGEVEVLIMRDGWGMWWDPAGQVSTAALPSDLFSRLRACLPELAAFVDEVGLPYRRVPPGVTGTSLTIVPDPCTGEKIEIVVAPGAIPPRLVEITAVLLQIGGLRGGIAVSPPPAVLPPAGAQTIVLRDDPPPAAPPAPAASSTPAVRTIQAQPTRYNGQRYRARGEALWAATFDLLNAQPVYEPEALLMPDPSGQGWAGAIPDFYLAGWDLLVEVKPRQFFDDDEKAKAIGLVKLTGKPILVTMGLPPNPDRAGRPFSPLTSLLIYIDRHDQIRMCGRTLLAACGCCGATGLLFDGRHAQGFRCFTTSCANAQAPFHRNGDGDPLAPSVLALLRAAHATPLQNC